MSERLERVTAFSELREGMIVVSTPCGRCGKSHRGITLRRLRGRQGQPDGSITDDVDQISAVPKPKCTEIQWTFSAITVSRGNVFRVLDGLEEPSTETAAASGTTHPAGTTRKKERVEP